MTTKTVYLYDETTGEYKSAYEAHQSPEDEHGVYIVPTHCLAAPPPALGPNQVAVAVAGQWEVAPDFRAATLYSVADGAVFPVTAIGEQPAGTTLLEPAPMTRWSGSEWVEDFERTARPVLRAFAVLRDRLIGRVLDIAIVSQQPDGNAETMKAALAIRRGLLDLPAYSSVKGASSAAGLQKAIDARIAELAAATTPELAKALAPQP